MLAISVDGLNPEALTTLGRDGTPTFWRLIDEGSATLNARSAYELTITLPNHAGMLSGRPVSGDAGTSVTFNDDTGGTLAATHGAYVPGLFDIAHDHDVSTALLAEKDKFAFLVRSWDRNHGAADMTGADDGRDKLDVAEIAPADELVDDVTDTLTSGDARLVFWHIAAPDAAGHAAGWLGPEYLAAVGDADEQIGSVLDALDADPALAARTTVLLTADHGGPRGAEQHDDATRLANYRIPFIAWGRGVRAGGDLYALNPDRADPGTSRPDYTGTQPIRNMDLADVALGLLGLPAVPGAATSALPPVILH
ncbi:MAG: type phosphodiesterase/nucleotide pyrophosphatase [Aeromicrobium sp.]|nr:type phosphodiesterase/nucleotide pyrophosphatase [Aeromicrobium sp.]